MTLVAFYIRTVVALVLAVAVYSEGNSPKNCLERYDDCLWLKKVSGLECEFKKYLCFSKYCHTTAGKNVSGRSHKQYILRVMTCFGRYAVPIHMEYFKKNPLE